MECFFWWVCLFVFLVSFVCSIVGLVFVFGFCLFVCLFVLISYISMENTFISSTWNKEVGSHGAKVCFYGPVLTYHQCEKQMRSYFPPKKLFISCVLVHFFLWPILHVLCCRYLLNCKWKLCSPWLCACSEMDKVFWCQNQRLLHKTWTLYNVNLMMQKHLVDWYLCHAPRPQLHFIR